MTKDDRELIERLSKALDFDAQAGTDEQWSRLMAEAMNARARLEALQPQPVGEDVLRRARQICADHDSDKAYQYLEGQRDDYMPMTAVLAALTASPPVVEREAIARIIAPSSFANEGSISWNERSAGRRNALAKADAILALTPVEKGITTDDTPVEGVGERAARTEYGWLIERDGHGGLRYATPRSWTADHMKALRFARKVDAEEFAASHQDWSTDIRITEHAWD